MSPPSRASLDAIDSDEDYISVIATNHRGRSVDTRLVEEYLVPHFRVAEQLRPANHLHVETDVAEPVEPSQAIRHRSTVLLLLEPVFDLFGQVADDIAVEWRCVVDKDVTAGRRLELALSDLIDVTDDLLNRVFLGGRVGEIIFLRLLELKNRNGVTGLIVAATGHAAIINGYVRAVAIR